MEEIELVIKIRKELYETIKKNGYIYEEEVEDVALSIMSGTLLPKGHGRLIDADELKALSYEVLVDTDNPNRADGLSACNGIVEDDIDLAPTIIEADKAER